MRCISFIGVFFFISVVLFSQTTENNVTQNDEQNSETTSEIADIPISESELVFSTENDTIPINAPGIGVSDALRVFFVLIVLLGLGVGVVWFLKKFQAKDINFNTSIIDIISSKQMSQTSSLHIIKVANEYMLIGNSGQAVNLIKAYTEKEKIDEITLALSEAESERSGGSDANTFLKRLQKKLFIQNTRSLSKKYTHTNIVSMILNRREK